MLRQKKPVVVVHAVSVNTSDLYVHVVASEPNGNISLQLRVVPSYSKIELQMHSALLAVVPSVSKQIGMVEHLLRDEVQNEPVVGVQCASPHTHPALLATLPLAWCLVRCRGGACRGSKSRGSSQNKICHHAVVSQYG